MNCTQLCTFLSIPVLFFQLAAIQITPEVPNIIYGEYSKLAKKEQFVFATQPEPVLLARSAAEHDSLVFVGDVLLARNVEYLMDRQGEAYPFSAVSFERFSMHPYVVGNFEAAVPQTHVPTPPRMLDFSVRESYLGALKKAGFTLLSLANNHAFDFGNEGYVHTIEAFSRVEVRTFGHPASFIQESVELVEIDDVQVAIIAIHGLERPPSRFELESIFSYATKRSDYQIAYVHWGTEYADTSDSLQRNLAKRYINAGADLIIGHHPHVVQEIGVIDEVPVLYSLGNYIFDQYFSQEVQEGLIAHIEFDGEPVIHLQPVSSEDSLSKPKPMDTSSHARFLEKLSEKSDESIKSHIINGVVPLELPVATEPKMAMISR